MSKTLLATSVAFAFALFGTTTGNAQQPAAPPAQVVHIGVTVNSTPFSFFELSTNSYDGANVKLVREIAQIAGLDLRIHPMLSSDFTAALNANIIDMTVLMPMTDANRAAVDISDPVRNETEALLIKRTDTTPYASYQDLRGKTVGVLGIALWANPLRESGVFREVKAYSSNPDLYRAVSSGEVEAAIVSQPAAAYTLLGGAYPDLQLVTSYQPQFRSQSGLAVQKGDAELLAKINAALATLKASGRARAIFDEYGLGSTVAE